MADDEPPLPPGVDDVTADGPHPDVSPAIEFAPATTRKKSDVRRIQLNALYFVALGVWALGLAFTGEPLLGPLAALVLFEMALAMFRVSSFVGRVVVDAGAFARIGPIVADLCAQAGCTPPRVVLRDDALRAAAVRRQRKRGKVDLVLSRPFVEAVTDPQLRGIIAHEIVHVVHHDLRRARNRARAAAVGGWVLGFGLWIAAGFDFKDLPIALAGFAAGMLLLRVALSPLNRPSEVRADTEGAALGGDARALADALAIAHAQSNTAKDRLYGSRPWRWLLAPLSWRMPTHPRMADRLGRLRQLA